MCVCVCVCVCEDTTKKKDVSLSLGRLLLGRAAGKVVLESRWQADPAWHVLSRRCIRSLCVSAFLWGMSHLLGERLRVDSPLRVLPFGRHE